MVQSILKCMQCRYDLRATLSNGCCPECGTLVAASVEAAAKRARRERVTARTIAIMGFVQIMSILLNLLNYLVSADSGEVLGFLLLFSGFWLVASIIWLIVSICLIGRRGFVKLSLIVLALFAVSVGAMLVNWHHFKDIILYV